MKIYKIVAIFKKQVKDTLKNKTIFIQFIMMPALCVILVNTMNMGDMPENFFVKLFATMYIGMAPLTSMAAIIAEEKEKNTLRVLMMSNVKASEYIIGIGVYIFLICMLGSLVFGMAGNYQGRGLAEFMLIMCIGVMISLMIGAAIGTLSKNEMAATSITVPVMMVFSFLPMIAMFNDNIGKVSRITYSQQINNLMQQVGRINLSMENILVIMVNLLIAVVLFMYAYKRCGF